MARHTFLSGLTITALQLLVVCSIAISRFLSADNMSGVMNDGIVGILHCTPTHDLQKGLTSNYVACEIPIQSKSLRTQYARQKLVQSSHWGEQF